MRSLSIISFLEPVFIFSYAQHVHRSHSVIFESVKKDFQAKRNAR